MGWKGGGVLGIGLRVIMSRFIQKLRDEVPGNFLLALGVCVCFLAFVVWDQHHWWLLKEDYMFGWLVPLFVAYVVYDRWPSITGALRECGGENSGRAGGFAKFFLYAFVGGLLVAGAGLFLIGALVRASTGGSQPSTLAISMGTGGIVLSLLFIAAPEARGETRRTGILGDARVQLALLFLFPAFVWQVSAPMVSVVENRLSLFLLGKVAAVDFFVFDLLGIPIEQQGNVLRFQSGAEVGVEEACSGIRSLTACLFVGAFLAAVCLKQFWKKVLLVACSMVLAFLTNLLRSLFLAAWVYNYGQGSIEGFVHDAAGYAVLGLTFVGLLCLLPLFNLRISFSDKLPPAEVSKK